MNTDNKEQQTTEIAEQVERNLLFEERLSQYPKEALTMALTQMSRSESTRKFILNCLEEMDGLMEAAKIRTPELRDSILDSIRQERLEQETCHGPVKMNPRTIGEWTDKLSRLITKASGRANMGREMSALKIILWVARDAVAALEDRIDSIADHHKDTLADAIGKVMLHPGEEPEAIIDITADPVERDSDISPEKTISKDGVLFRGHHYWASWMADRQGETVRVKTPSDPQSIVVVESPHIHQVIGEAHRVDISTADDAPTPPAANDLVTENSN